MINIKHIIENTVNKIYDMFEISKDNVFNLDQFLNDLNITINYSDHLNYKGKIEKVHNQIIITIKNNDNDFSSRFNIAHQLGHYFLHFEDNTTNFKDSVFYRNLNYNDEEIEANLFASYLLMPNSQFIRYANQYAYDSINDTYNIDKISKHFKVPKQIVINKGKILRIFK